MAKKTKWKYKRLKRYRDENGEGLLRNKQKGNLKKVYDDCEVLETRLLVRDIGDEVFKHGRFRV